MKYFLGTCVSLLVSCSVGTPMTSFIQMLPGWTRGLSGSIPVGSRNAYTRINLLSPAMKELPNLPSQTQPQYVLENELQMPTENEKQPDLGTLQEVMRACGRILRYFRQHLTQMNLDAVIGTRIAEAQFKMVLIALEEKAEKWMEDGNDGWMMDTMEWEIVITSLRSLHREAVDLNTLAQPFIQSSTPDYYSDLGNLLEPGFWEVPLSTKVFDLTHMPHSTSNKVLDEVEQLEESQSDECVAEVGGAAFTSDNNNHDDARKRGQCFISQECWDLMTSPDFSGYSLTHQAFYIIIGLQAGCGDQEEQLARTTVRNETTMTVTTLLEQFCYSILNEANTIAQAGFPETRRDLFMEQGALCGLVGYRDFFRKEWLATVLSWQKLSGCYGEADKYCDTRSERSAESTTFTPLRTRVKREESPMAGCCLAHKSAVAIGYLSMYVRYLALAIFQ